MHLCQAPLNNKDRHFCPVRDGNLRKSAILLSAPALCELPQPCENQLGNHFPPCALDLDGIHFIMGEAFTRIGIYDRPSPFSLFRKRLRKKLRPFVRCLGDVGFQPQTAQPAAPACLPPCHSGCGAEDPPARSRPERSSVRSACQ